MVTPKTLTRLESQNRLSGGTARVLLIRRLSNKTWKNWTGPTAQIVRCRGTLWSGYGCDFDTRAKALCIKLLVRVVATQSSRQEFNSPSLLHQCACAKDVERAEQERRRLSDRSMTKKSSDLGEPKAIGPPSGTSVHQVTDIYYTDLIFKRASTNLTRKYPRQIILISLEIVAQSSGE